MHCMKQHISQNQGPGVAAHVSITLITLHQLHYPEGSMMSSIGAHQSVTELGQITVCEQPKKCTICVHRHCYRSPMCDNIGVKVRERQQLLL